MFCRAVYDVICIVIFIFSSALALSLHKFEPTIRSVSVRNESLSNKKNYTAVLAFSGENFPDDFQVRITNELAKSGSSCSKSVSYGRLKKTWSNESYAEVDLEMREDEFVSDHWFTCVKAVYRTDEVLFSSTLSTDVVKWVHQGYHGSFVSEMSKKKGGLNTGYHSIRLVIYNI